MFQARYSRILEDNPIWEKIPAKKGDRYPWDEQSTYIRKPPFFAEREKDRGFSNFRALALFGDSVTTDHISPAGAFKKDTPAGKYLLAHGVSEEEFNSYGSRRGNHEVMMRGTFANVRLLNRMAGGKEGGFTKHIPSQAILPIFEACEKYQLTQTPLIIFAGKDYGMGSSRDWAAKGTALLGVKAVVAQSFERIHRSNLIGMGVLPLQFQNDTGWEKLGITGDETFDLVLEKTIQPRQTAYLHFKTQKIPLTLCIETPIEVEYYKHGGILPYVLNNLC